jgi:cell division protein FtsZ
MKNNELKVTVVATGLGRKDEERVSTPIKILDNTRPDGTLDYHQLDRPTVMRNQANKQPVEVDMDYLDIPAFLRRQED